jgi:hypothetical protein
MIWLNPWAWLGLAGIALPVIIHILARGHARVHPFPTLRFLDASHLLPTRRTRIQDPLLLLLRCTIIALATAALAQPLLLTSDRKRALDRGLARAILVDTSASMRRFTTNGVLAVDSARREARSLSESAQASIVVESSDPTRALTGAAAWLTRQGRRAELVVISDFQRGQLDSAAFAVVPGDIGLQLRRVAVGDTGAVGISSLIVGNRVVSAARSAGPRTEAEWTTKGPDRTSDAVVLLGAETDRDALRAMSDAASTVALPLPMDTNRAVAIVFPSYTDRNTLHAAAREPSAPWMAELLSRLYVEALPITGAGVATVAGRERLILFTDSIAGSVATTRVAALANRALSIAPPAREMELETMSDAELTALQRPIADNVASQNRPPDANGPTDARWLWLAALVLLLVELPLRRRRAPAPATTAEERARAA